MKCYLNVVNIKKSFFSGYIKKIFITCAEGELCIYPGHSPLLSIVHVGPLCIVKEDNIKEYFYISGGFLEVQPNNVNILSDTIIPHYNLSKKDLLIKQKNIKKKIIHYKENKYNLLKKKLSQIIVQLKVLEIAKKK